MKQSHEKHKKQIFPIIFFLFLTKPISENKRINNIMPWKIIDGYGSRVVESFVYTTFFDE